MRFTDSFCLGLLLDSLHQSRSACGGAYYRARAGQCSMLSGMRTTALRQIVKRIIAVVTVAFLAMECDSEQPDRQLQLWLTIKRQLTRPDGERYFESSMKDSVIPAGANGVSMLKRTLTSALFNQGVSRLVLGLSDATTAEVTLVLHNGDVDITSELGAQVEFQGVAIDFTKDPFMLTFDVQLSETKGLKLQK